MAASDAILRMNTKRKLSTVGIVVGTLLTLAPAIGLLGTVFGMTHAFSTLGSAGISDPRALSHGIAVTLLATATGIFLFPFGVIVLTLSLIYYFRLRASVPPPLPAQPTQ